MTETPLPGRDVPLIVDLDGTYIKTDMLLETFWKGLGAAPIGTVRTAFTHLTDRPKLKARLAEIAPVTPETLPVDPEVAEMIDAARQAGREVYLVSGSTESIVQGVAASHPVFTSAHGSSEDLNLTKTNKRDYLVERFGEKGFDYIGDSSADLPVWQAARTALVARPGTRIKQKLDAEGLATTPVGEAWRWEDLLRGLRPHQWLKNMLLFLPLFVAHRMDAAGLIAASLGVIAFSALASAIYIVNDLTDLEADRLHDTKRNRPFAAGRVPIKVGMAASLALGLLGLAIGAALSWAMLAVLLVYLVSTLSYSFRFKRVRWVDVTMLAGLYTLRVVAGAVAAGVAASGWLFAFIFPIFLSLGCVKRLTELAHAKGTGNVPGRRYSPADRDDLLNVAILGAVAAVSVFAAYSVSSTAAALYAHIWMLWAVAILLGLWLARMIRTGWTGAQDYDPIIFAITDKIGVSLVVGSMALLVASAR
ncbi:MAG: UbiA family prenyltransferase [Pseudomonadota bacterium]